MQVVMSSRLLLVLVLLVMSVGVVNAQYVSVGVTGGSSFYFGDLNKSELYQINKQSYGVFLRQNLTPRHTFKYAFNYAQVAGSDALSSDPYQRARNLSFYSNVYEFSVHYEFNYFKFDPLANNEFISNYFFVGLGAFYMNPKAQLAGSEYILRTLRTEAQAKPYSRIQMVLPFGAGVRMRLHNRLLLTVEVGFRKTFTDYLDDVSTYYPQQNQLSILSSELSNRTLPDSPYVTGEVWGKQRGDSYTKDWYVISNVGLSWRFGKKKGSCFFTTKAPRKPRKVKVRKTSL